MTFEIVRTVADLRARVRAWRHAGETIGVVPTMGALHEGHLRLIDAARLRCTRVIATIFVNPTQFAPSEDFARYPRREAEDAAKLAARGTALLYAPTLGEIYPPGFVSEVRVAKLTDHLCGAFRPGHFAGVATIVTKLLQQTQPDRAFFGEKDYQQLQVIKRMVRDLDMPFAIEGVATVREASGLAMSSRNEYLTQDQRAAAPQLYRVLCAIANALARGADIAAQRAWGMEELGRHGFAPIDYLEICDAEDLQPLTEIERPARVLVAAYLGKTRLIDNVAVAISGLKA
ncbi:MAG: pantoate--beta-alanine ligase [Alphaproteobacteria bacterium]